MCFHLMIQKINVAVKFEGEKVQDAIYEITLCKYLDLENELPIDPKHKVFLCGTSSVRYDGILQNEKFLQIIRKR